MPPAILNGSCCGTGRLPGGLGGLRGSGTRGNGRPTSAHAYAQSIHTAGTQAARAAGDVTSYRSACSATCCCAASCCAAAAGVLSAPRRHVLAAAIGILARTAARATGCSPRDARHFTCGCSAGHWRSFICELATRRPSRRTAHATGQEAGQKITVLCPPARLQLRHLQCTHLAAVVPTDARRVGEVEEPSGKSGGHCGGGQARCRSGGGGGRRAGWVGGDEPWWHLLAPRVR